LFAETIPTDSSYFKIIALMKFGLRIPSLTKRIAARTSVKRIVQNKLGLKMPRGYGWVTNPHKFIYNKVYTKTTTGIGCMLTLLVFIAIPLGMVLLLLL
jgi:hypothetical protein